jgi:hypothetical protein
MALVSQIISCHYYSHCSVHNGGKMGIEISKSRSIYLKITDILAVFLRARSKDPE